MLSLATVTLAFVSLALFQLPASAAFAQDEDDTFFSGTLDEFTHESATVTREVLGNAPERRTFVITAQTKIEGKLTDGARVTTRRPPLQEGNDASPMAWRQRFATSSGINRSLQAW